MISDTIIILSCVCSCAATVSIPAMLSVAEEEGTVSVCAALAITPATATTSRAITVALATSNGTATAALDYVSVSEDLTFPAGSGDGAVQCLCVSISNDCALEGEETFTVILTTEEPDMILHSTTIVTITENEGMYKHCSANALCWASPVHDIVGMGSLI